MVDRIQQEVVGDGMDATQKMFGSLMSKVTEEDTMSLPPEDILAGRVAFHVYDDPFTRPRTLDTYALLEDHNEIETCVYRDEAA